MEGLAAAAGHPAERQMLRAARPVEQEAQVAPEQEGLKARLALKAVDPAEQVDRAAVVNRKALQVVRAEPLRAQPARKPAEQAVAEAVREDLADLDKGRTPAP